MCVQLLHSKQPAKRIVLQQGGDDQSKQHVDALAARSSVSETRFQRGTQLFHIVLSQDI